MHQILNTLYVQTQGAYLHLDHETVRVDVESETKLQVPLHHLGSIACFGDVMVSPALMRKCAEDGRGLAYFDRTGRFKARLEGPVSGNVLLRRAQHVALDDSTKVAGIARAIVAGKIQNSRQILQRGAREADNPPDAKALEDASKSLAAELPRLQLAVSLDVIRGIEGDAARTYFGIFDRLVRERREVFYLKERTRRPPRDPLNALLSFLYALLLSDCVAGAEGVGLDPQVGFLHALRPGRPALGLDLMEEFRSVLADRLALTLINRAQVSAEDFEERAGGACYLSESGRKAVVTAYQKRKQDEVTHTVLDQRLPLGLAPHAQARLLARHLRGDLEGYVPFLYR